MQRFVLFVAVALALGVCVPVAGAEPKAATQGAAKGGKDVVVGGPDGGYTTQHDLRVDADANGDEVIYYDDRSTYGGVVRNARGAWNALDRRFDRRGVVFRPVSKAPPGTRLELIFTSAVCEAYAFYDPNGTPDRIVFCKNNMDTLNDLRRDETGAHEVGHAIGLAHPAPCRRYLKRSIMIGGCGFADSRQPLKHDVRDYRRYWVD